MSHPHHHEVDFGRAFAIGVLLNTGFIAAEVVFGLLSDSLTLLADAGHNLSDVMGLLVAWGALSLQRRSPTKRFTYGLRRTSVLAALANAILLLVSVGAIAWEAIRRLNESSWTREIPIVAVSAVPYSRQTALAAGCDAYLTKPCDPQTLWSQVRALLGLQDSGSELG